MRSAILWSLTLLSCLPSARGDDVKLPQCSWPCLQPAFQSTNCLDLQCLCTTDPELQQLFQCIFKSCNAVEYSLTIKIVTRHCVNSTITNTIQQLVSNQSPNKNALVTRSSPIQLNVNLNMGQDHDVESDTSRNTVPIAEKMASPSVAAEESADRKSPIEMNINLNYGNEISGGTPTSPNPDIHVEKLLMGVSITTEKSPTIADCPPTYADGDRAPPVEPPGPFVSSGHPPNPPGPFVSSGPPSGGNRGNNAPPRAVTITQTVTAAPAGGGLGSSSFGAGAGAGGYNYRSGQGGGGSSSGSYGAGAGNGPGNGGYGGGGSPAYGPPGGSNNGQVLTIIQTTTACLNSDNSNRNGNGYGSGNEGSPPCPSGNVNSGACSSQPAMSGPFVETVFIMGTPSPLAIVPTTCRSSGNGSNDLPPYPAPAPVAATAPCLEPPPPPPPPPSAPAPLPAVVTVTQRVAAPQPPSPPPAPLAYSPTNSVAYFGAKGVGTELEVTASTASFSTVTLTVPAGSQQNEQLPDIGDYGGPGSSGGGVSPVNGDPGDNGGVGPANGSGVAPISAIPPSAWGGGGVSPAQVTASRAIQDGPSLSILFYTLFLPSFQILLLSC